MISGNSRQDADHAAIGRAKLTLSKSKIAAIRNVSVEAVGGSIVLLGQVPMYYYKQLAQELVRNEISDAAIHNRIEVVAQD
jgi:hypothetical protein